MINSFTPCWVCHRKAFRMVKVARALGYTTPAKPVDKSNPFRTVQKGTMHIPMCAACAEVHKKDGTR